MSLQKYPTTAVSVPKCRRVLNASADDSLGYVTPSTWVAKITCPALATGKNSANP